MTRWNCYTFLFLFTGRGAAQSISTLYYVYHVEGR
jgi:hypothetical protein